MEEFNSDLLNNCELEPLANSGLIQAHGATLFLSRDTGEFNFGSENLETFLGESCEELLGQSGDEWVGEMLPDLPGLPTGAGNRAYLPKALDLGEGELNVLISPTAAGWLFEFEKSQVNETDILAPQLPELRDGANLNDMHDVHQAVVDGLAQITGYDRIMLYQFLPDWSGEVLAESVLRSSGSYLSLRFPASDIPAIARGLYAQTPYRYIPLATNDTVNILGRGEVGSTLDLTWSDLRSVSPVHIQYLTNMNVHASFSVSIMVDGKLWGLIASHNDVPGPISLSARLACVNLIQQFSARIETQRIGQQKFIAEQLSDKIGSSLKGGSSPNELATTLAKSIGGLADQIEFSDCIIDVGGAFSGLNTQPDAELVKSLVGLSETKGFEELVVLETLPDDFDKRSKAHNHGIFGCAILTVRAATFGNTLVTVMLTRPEESGEVAWAGNPQKPVETLTTGGVKLSPRESFEKWIDVRQGMSKTWNEDDLFTLGLLRRQLDLVLG